MHLTSCIEVFRYCASIFTCIDWDNQELANDGIRNTCGNIWIGALRDDRSISTQIAIETLYYLLGIFDISIATCVFLSFFTTAGRILTLGVSLVIHRTGGKTAK